MAQANTKPAQAESGTASPKGPVQKFLRAATVPILVFLVICGSALVTGLRLCPNTTGSMAPTIPAYSLCLIDTHVDYDSLQTGDIIVYDRPYDHMQVIHRIVAIFDEGVLTQGDANPVDDGILLTEADITGVYLCHIPGAGLAANPIRTPVGITVILAVVVLLLLSDARAQQKKSKDSDTPDEQ